MANDFKQKEPTKAERMIYELAMNQNSMEKGLWSTSTLVMVLGILTKANPEEVAELMVNGDEKIKEFSGKVNEAIKKLEAEKHPATHEASADKHGEDHSGHDHSHEGHDHAHAEEKEEK